MNRQQKAKTVRVASKAIQRQKNAGKTKVETSIREALAKELLAVSFSFLLRQGFLARELRGLAKDCLKEPSEFPASTFLMRDISRLGRLISEWTENARYVDPGGRPKVLLITGESISFEELAAKHFGDRPVRDVLKFAIKFKAIERISDRSVAHLGSCVLLTGNRTLLLSHAVRAVRGFLATNEYNGRKMRGTPWPERQASTELPEEKFAEFLRFMREPIINLIDMGNRWLMANAAVQQDAFLGKGKQKKVFAGVHAYLFRDA